MNESPVIAGLGAQTAVGLNLAANVAAVRSALNSFRLSDYLLGFESGEPLKVSQLITLPRTVRSSERMKSMAVGAAREATAPWFETVGKSGGPDLPVLLAIPGPRPGIHEGIGSELMEALIEELPIQVDKAYSVLAITGNEGGLAALSHAVNLVRFGVRHAVLVGGVECYHEIETLHWLEAQGRLKLEDYPNGFIPGEGAGFVLVCSKREAERRRLSIFAEILAAGRGTESRLWFSGKATIGEGLTQALQEMFNDPYCPEGRVRVTYCDLNGEVWRAEEWSYAYVRTGTRHGSPLDLRHPAANWGDVGAASGPLLVALASFELNRYFKSEDLALVWTASDMQPYRSACLLRRSQE